MNTEEPHDDYGKLTHQQQRFCDLYLTHFNAFKAAVECGYSENTSRKGALLHVPKIQQYLKEAMNRRSQRLEITHDMILRELSKIAFSNMGNYYDEYGCLKRINELTVDEKGAIAYYDIVEIQDAESYRIGQQSRIKLHNKMSALDKIARHLDFYGTLGREVKGEREKAKGEENSQKLKAESEKEESPMSERWEDGLVGAENTPLTPLERGNRFERDAVMVDKSINNLPMDYPVEDFELEGIDLKNQRALEGVNVSPGRALMIEGLNDGMIEWEEGLKSESREVRKTEEEESPISESRKVRKMGEVENMENILTISPLLKSQKSKLKSQNDLPGGDGVREFALGMGADTGPARGSGQAVAKACAV